MAKAKPVPDGFNTVSAHLIVRNAAEAVKFYRKAFGAEEVMQMPGPDGKTVMHAELKIGDSRVMICDEFPDMGCSSPQAIGGSPVTLHLYVNDVDTMFNRAISAGATATMPVTDMFWGDRYGKLVDPYGHHWSIATHKEDLTPAQIQKRQTEFFSQGHGCGQG